MKKKLSILYVQFSPSSEIIKTMISPLSYESDYFLYANLVCIVECNAGSKLPTDAESPSLFESSLLWIIILRKVLSDKIGSEYIQQGR